MHKVTVNLDPINTPLEAHREEGAEEAPKQVQLSASILHSLPTQPEETDHHTYQLSDAQSISSQDEKCGLIANQIGIKTRDAEEDILETQQEVSDLSFSQDGFLDLSFDLESGDFSTSTEEIGLSFSTSTLSELQSEARYALSEENRSNRMITQDFMPEKEGIFLPPHFSRRKPVLNQNVPALKAACVEFCKYFIEHGKVSHGDMKTFIDRFEIPKSKVHVFATTRAALKRCLEHKSPFSLSPKDLRETYRGILSSMYCSQGFTLGILQTISTLDPQTITGGVEYVKKASPFSSSAPHIDTQPSIRSLSSKESDFSPYEPVPNQNVPALKEACVEFCKYFLERGEVSHENIKTLVDRFEIPSHKRNSFARSRSILKRCLEYQPPFSLSLETLQEIYKHILPKDLIFKKFILEILETISTLDPQAIKGIDEESSSEEDHPSLLQDVSPKTPLPEDKSGRISIDATLVDAARRSLTPTERIRLVYVTCGTFLQRNKKTPPDHLIVHCCNTYGISEPYDLKTFKANISLLGEYLTSYSTLTKEERTQFFKDCDGGTETQHVLNEAAKTLLGDNPLNRIYDQIYPNHKDHPSLSQDLSPKTPLSNSSRPMRSGLTPLQRSKNFYLKCGAFLQKNKNQLPSDRLITEFGEICDLSDPDDLKSFKTNITLLKNYLSSYSTFTSKEERREFFKDCAGGEETRYILNEVAYMLAYKAGSVSDDSFSMEERSTTEDAIETTRQSAIGLTSDQDTVALHSSLSEHSTDSSSSSSFPVASRIETAPNYKAHPELAAEYVKSILGKRKQTVDSLKEKQSPIVEGSPSKSHDSFSIEDGSTTEDDVYRKRLKNRFLTTSIAPQTYDLHSRLAHEQWSLAPDQNFEGSPCQIPDSSIHFGIETEQQ